MNEVNVADDGIVDRAVIRWQISFMFPRGPVHSVYIGWLKDKTVEAHEFMPGNWCVGRYNAYTI